MKKRFSIIINVFFGVLELLLAIVFFISIFAFFNPLSIVCGILLVFDGLMDVISAIIKIKE